MIADIDKKKIWKVVRKTCAERGKISLLKDLKIRKRYDDKEMKLVDIGAPNLWEEEGGEVKEIHGGGKNR